MLQVYSTLTRKKEPFHKKPGDAVTMYVCGPTVYKPSHIGHMVGPVIFDTVKRYLTYLGYKVKWVVNITDVDDKLIKRAGELNTTVPELSVKMTEDYFACLKALNVTGIDHFPKATEHIGGMIEVIQSLIKKDYAYEVDDGVYFDVAKDKDYGALSNRDPEQMEAGARLEPNPKKRNPGDFALWKSKPGEPTEVQFASPFKCGRGRPGWHIECTCMAIKELGETLDIHGGGLDLLFPHHENELAQSESLTDKPFARVWMHNGLLRLGKEKMAGSVGNVVNVAEALPHMSGDAIRFFVLGTHYRSPIEMGEWPIDPETKKHVRPLPDGMLSAKVAHETFMRFTERVQRVTGKPFADLTPPKELTPTQQGFQQTFLRRMDDDFNTGGAVGVLFELLNALNQLAHSSKLEDPSVGEDGARKEFECGAALLKHLGGILGLTFTAPSKSVGGDNELTSKLIQLVIDVRGNLRAEAKKIASKEDPVKAALFAQATQIRESLAKLGVTLEDRPGGTTWRVG